MRHDTVVSAVNRIMEEYEIKLTIRQLYYRIISPPYQLFANTINNYKQFDKILTRARERGEINWRRIEDRARQTIGGDYGWNDPDEYLNYLIEQLKESDQNFTMPVWDNQPKYVEIWVEKDALASLFADAVGGLRVVTFPSRGYSSFTKVMEAMAERFLERAKKGQPIIVLHFSDHDPSGLNMTDDLLNRFKKYLKLALSEMEHLDYEETHNQIEKTIQEGKNWLGIIRVALTYDQVKELNLAPNPTKQADPRSKDYVAKYGDQCWELDAYPPDRLQDLIRQAVNTHIDPAKWNETRTKINMGKGYLKHKLAKMKIEFNEE